MAKLKKSPKSITRILGDERSKLSHLATLSEILLTLSKTFPEVVGATIAENSRISNFKQHTLFIETSSSPYAMRIRFLQQKIIAHYQLQLPALRAIEVSVVPSVVANQKLIERNNSASSVTESPFKISRSTAESLECVAELAGDELKAKILRLAKIAKEK